MPFPTIIGMPRITRHSLKNVNGELIPLEIDPSVQEKKQDKSKLV